MHQTTESTAPGSANKTAVNNSNSFPAGDDPSLCLVFPTDKEKREIWASTHYMWGSALSQDVYVKREAYLQNVPLAKEKGITNWLLTTSSESTADRTILASCEDIRKRALVAVRRPDGSFALKEGTTHAVGAVFCDPKYRGKGYANRLIKELAPALHDRRFKPEGQNAQASNLKNGEEDVSSAAYAHARPGEPLFSVLYSDIGKQFYSKHGWQPFAAKHVAFPPSLAYAGPSSEDLSAVKLLSYHDMATLTALDEKILREKLVDPAAFPACCCSPSTTATKAPDGDKKQENSNDSSKDSKGSEDPVNGKPNSEAAGQHKIRVAIIPDLDSMLWHLMREDYMTEALFGRTPTVRGAMVGNEAEGNRVWAVWTRNYYSPDRTDAKKNTFYILRFGVEDDRATSKEYLADAFRKIMAVAKKEAADWHVGAIHMWNPTGVVCDAIRDSGLECSWADRESDSIPSLRWYGEDGDTEDVDWVWNEKYAWC